MRKYFTWTTSEGYFRGNDLLEYSQIAALLEHTHRSAEAFVSIQDYDDSGEIVRCPLYFDIDSPDILDAYETMRAIVDDLMWDFILLPHVWFSGGKGFHVIVPAEIKHPRCHEIAGMVAQEYSSELDVSVYRTRSMWRVNNTYNKKAGRYKIKCNWDDKLEDILRASEENRNLNTDPVHWHKDPPYLCFKKAEKNLPERRLLPKNVCAPSFEGNMTPCLRKLWEMEEPPAGQRHHIAHLIARHGHKNQLSEDDLIAIFQAHPFWKNITQRDYEKVIRSVYRTNRNSIGCRSGRDSEILKPHCSEQCLFNEEVDWGEILWSNT